MCKNEAVQVTLHTVGGFNLSFQLLILWMNRRRGTKGKEVGDRGVRERE